MYTPKAILSIRAMQHLISLGWPNKGLRESKAEDFLNAQKAFQAETGREMTVRDLNYQGVKHNEL